MHLVTKSIDVIVITTSLSSMLMTSERTSQVNDVIYGIVMHDNYFFKDALANVKHDLDENKRCCSVCIEYDTFNKSFHDKSKS